MFERDKEELRSLGVPIEVGSLDAFFDDEPGYRIRPDEFALPEISLRPTRPRWSAWPPGSGSTPGSPRPPPRRVRKLSAAGRGGRRVGPRHRRSRGSAADEPAFDVVLGGDPERDAGQLRLPPRRRRPSRHPAPPAVGRRPLLRPLVRRRPRHRPRRGAGLPALPGRRATPRRDGQPGVLRGPAGHRRPRASPGGWHPRRRRARPSVLVRAGTGLGLRRKAEPRRGRTSPARTATPAGTAVASRRGDGWPTRCSTYGADVVVESPAELRDDRRAPGCAPCVDGRPA